MKRELNLIVTATFMGIVSSRGQTATWVGGNSYKNWSAATNWSPQAVPTNSPGNFFTVIVPDSTSVSYNIPGANAIDGLSFGSGAGLALTNGGGLTVNNASVLRGAITAAGTGSALSALSGQTVFGGTPTLAASSGGRIAVGASSYAWPYYNGSVTLLSAIGAGSRVDLTNLSSFVANYGDGGSWTYSILARSNGVIDMMNVLSIVGAVQDDWLDLNVDNGGDLRLDSLGTLSQRIHFNIGVTNYALPALSQDSGTYFSIATNSSLSLPLLPAFTSGGMTIAGGSRVDAPSLTTLDSVNLTLLATNAAFMGTNVVVYRNSYVPFYPGRAVSLGPLTDIFASQIAVTGGATGRVAATSYDMWQDWRSSFTVFSADGTNSLLDLSSLQSLTSWGGWGGAWTYSITANNNGIIDLSGLAAVTGPRTDAYDNDDWLAFNIQNGGNLRLPNLQTITRKTRWNVNVPLFTLPAAQASDSSQYYLGTSDRLEFPVLRSLTNGYVSLADGATFNAPTLASIYGTSFGWGFNSTFNAPSVASFVYSSVDLAPGRNFNVPWFTNIFASTITVSGGRSFKMAATSYDMWQDWRSSFTVFSADGTGSLLDLSSLQSLTSWGGWGGAWTYSITANNNGIIDLSGLTTVTGPRTDAYDNDDWLAFNIQNGGNLRLPNLQTITRKTRWNVNVPLFTLPAAQASDSSQYYLGTSDRLEFPVLRSLTNGYVSLADGATFNAPTLASIYGTSFGWGFNSTFNAPSVASFVYSSVDLAPGRNFNVPWFTNIFASTITVSGGRSFKMAATSYDMWQDWRSSFTVFSADGTGSLLDLSSLQSLTSWGGWGGAWTYSITANNNGIIDLSGLTTVTGPRTDAYDNDDWLAFNIQNGGLIRLGNTSVSRKAKFLITGNVSRLVCNGIYLRPEQTFTASSLSVFEVKGDFAYENTDPNSIVIEGGYLQMDSALPQRLEVGGRDSGANGFTTHNFGCSQLIVGNTNQTSVVRLVDTLNNGNRGSGGEPEALYLYGQDGAGLRLLNGSRLVINGINCYAFAAGQMKSLRSLIPAGTNSAPFDGGFIAINGGPRITNMTPAIALTPPVSSVDVSFDIPIKASTFTTADVTIAGPGGPVTPTSVTLVSGTTYRISFAAQNADGAYTVRIGPAIDELAGNLGGMDQNQDGLSGDGTNDVFTGVFTIDGAAPAVVGAFALQSGTSVGLTFNEPVAPAFATNPANYRVNGSAPATAALQTNGSAVILTVAPVLGDNFALSISNAADLLGNTTNRNPSGTILPQTSIVLGTAGSDPLVPGSTTPFDAGTFLDVAGGSYIWDTVDHGRFTYEARTGNFDLRVRLEGMTRPGPWTEAGLMARETTNASSRHVYANVEYGTGYNRFIAGYRQASSGGTAYWPGGDYSATVPVPNAWMRLKREGDVFRAFQGTNGLDWTEYARLTNVLPSTLLVGLASSAVNNGAGQTTTASYRDYSDFSPSILSQPASQSVTSGVSVVFGVTARGLPALTYQWYQNGLILAGRTNALLTLSAVTTNQVGDYFAVVSNPYGSTTSQVATLVVNGVGLGGFEADVSPLPNGNNAVTVSDWVRVGRLVAGLETPLNSGDFQRADCAPRTNAVLGTLPLGNGVLTVADWTQAGRYAAGLDPLTPAGGPTQSGGPVPPPPHGKGPQPRVVEVVNARAAQGQLVSVAVQLAGTGVENAAGFSLSFDAGRLAYQRTTLGAGAAGCSLQINDLQAASGRLGLVLAKPSGQAFGAGAQELARVEFVASGTLGAAAINLADAPVYREVADARADVLGVDYVDGAVTVIQAPHLDSHVVVNPAGVQLRLSGAAGERYRVEVSNDLQNWTVLTDAVAGAQPVVVTDAAGGRDTQRFYRAIAAP